MMKVTPHLYAIMLDGNGHTLEEFIEKTRGMVAPEQLVRQNARKHHTAKAEKILEDAWQNPDEAVRTGLRLMLLEALSRMIREKNVDLECNRYFLTAQGFEGIVSSSIRGRKGNVLKALKRIISTGKYWVALTPRNGESTPPGEKESTEEPTTVSER